MHSAMIGFSLKNTLNAPDTLRFRLLLTSMAIFFTLAKRVLNTKKASEDH